MSAANTVGLSVSGGSFGNVPDGTPVEKFTLTNIRRMQVGIITYGGIVQFIKVPDGNGHRDDVVLGFDKLADYLRLNPYFGAIIGRYGNRIAKGQFTLNGKRYRIPINDGPNALHGGTRGFDKRVWEAKPIHGGNRVGVELSYLSPAGEMGFPGELAVTVRYTLNNDNELCILYSAVSDADTVLNLTNHTYFNLAGAGDGTVLDQVAMINADRFTPVDKALIPTGEIRHVSGTPLDFTAPTPIGAHIRADYPQLRYAGPGHGGYDFNWVLNRPGNVAVPAARVSDPGSGRVVEMYTTEPGVQFYTGNSLDGSIKGKGDRAYRRWGAFALEAQHFPDSPNHPDFPTTRLKLGERYEQTTIYKFLPL